MGRLSSTTFLCLLTSLTGISRAVAVEDLTRVHQRAVALYQSGDYKTAVPLYRRLAAAHDPNSAYLKDYLVVSWLGEQYRDAAEVGARLTKIRPDDVEIWFIYARSLLATGRKEEALLAFKRCRQLAPSAKDIQLGEARAAAALRDSSRALPLFLDLKQRFPDYKELYPELARLQQQEGQYREAAENWQKAVTYFPDVREYRFHEAESLYYSNRQEEARQKLQAWVAEPAAYWPAVDFAVNDATAQGRYAEARQLLETHLAQDSAQDGSRWLMVARLAILQRDGSAAISALDRLLKLYPGHGQAMLLKATCLRGQGRLAEARALYQETLQRNPGSLTSLMSLAEIESETGFPDKAIEAITRAQALDPTDPYLILRHTQYLYERGDVQASQSQLRDWIQKDTQPVLPVLLYHGLTPVPGDPLLAYALHRRAENFEDHLHALKEAGYQPIDTQRAQAWLQGKVDLPARAVLVTFDDARLDSFQWGDPILQKYDFKATMFVPVVNVEGYFSKFATWKELAHYNTSGRWEMQSHGDRAHEYIPIDEQGHRGLFLLNRRWMTESGRLETAAEWQTRIGQDHLNAQRKLQLHLNRMPQAYSFPEGDYGQEDAHNAPDAADVNLRSVRQVYQTAYHPDEFGLNVRTRDAMHLTRYEPPPDMRGSSLIKHFTDRTPAAMMLRQLVRQSAWEGELKQAHQWLAELKNRQVSKGTLLAEEARIYLAEGDRDRGRRLAAEAVSQEDSTENRELLNSIDLASEWVWEGRFAYQEDNRSRVSRRFRQDLGFWQSHGLDLSLHHVWGSYSEGGVNSVTEHGGGVRVARNLNLYHRFFIEATGHALSGKADDQMSLIGNLRSSLSESWNSELEVGRSIYDTARALEANVISVYGRGILRWQREDWRVAAKVRGADLSDNNTRLTGSLEAGHRVLWPRLWLIGRVMLDDMDRVSPNYYSPELLQTYQVGFDFKQRLTRRIDFFVEYLPGYGKERNTDGEFVQDLDAGLDMRLTRALGFRPSITVVHTPSYHRRTIAALLTYRF